MAGTLEFRNGGAGRSTITTDRPKKRDDQCFTIEGSTVYTKARRGKKAPDGARYRCCFLNRARVGGLRQEEARRFTSRESFEPGLIPSYDTRRKCSRGKERGLCWRSRAAGRGRGKKGEKKSTRKEPCNWGRWAFYVVLGRKLSLQLGRGNHHQLMKGIPKLVTRRKRERKGQLPISPPTFPGGRVPVSTIRENVHSRA